MPQVATRLLAWGARHGRRGLPWQGTRDPYRVWLSEIMLQQTQVARVVAYYERFLARFPTVAHLAAAAPAEVLSLWSGLGYYSRARHLHACARRIAGEFGGVFPGSAEALAALPGIGRSTAAAIAAFCFGQRVPILDGNVRRVLTRLFAIDRPPGAALDRQLWPLAESLLPERAADMPAYTQALMDLGATLCAPRLARCDECPLRRLCRARQQARVDDLPVPRPRRAVRLRKALWLVPVHAGQVLLEQRPAVGLWGGLLAPLHFDDADALRRAAAAWIDPQPGAPRLQALAPRRHAFTHFTLEFSAHLLRVDRTVTGVRMPGQVWLPLADVESAPLPAPVRALLGELAKAEGGSADRAAGETGKDRRRTGGAGTRRRGAGRAAASYSGSMPSATRKRDTML